MKKFCLYTAVLMTALAGAAQELNTEITVSHEVVPEERAATRMRWLPTVNLPSINTGRLPMASYFLSAGLTPYLVNLQAAQYGDSLTRSGQRGYAAIGYGPVYNLAASAGYRFVEKENMTVNAYMQFDGKSYTSKYPGIDYDGKVNFHRNTALVGGDIAYTLGAHSLTGALLYQYSNYNFPILDLRTLDTDKHFINTNIVKANVGWNTTYRNADFHASADYGMIYFGKNKANNNRISVKSGVALHASTKSTWTFDFNFSIDKSSLLYLYKDIFELHPAYNYANKKFKLRFGIDIDIPKYYQKYDKRYDDIKLRVVPELALDWQIAKYFNFWLNSTWDMVDNNRLAMYEEQPYLLPEFDTLYSSGIWKMQLGIGLGPFRGASLKVYVTPTIAENWYIPAIETGIMTNRIRYVSTSWETDNNGVTEYYKEYSVSNHISGYLFGASFNYDYRHYLSLSVTGEYCPHRNGDYRTGYAPWRDHAKSNLVAQATVRPIKKLDVTLGYQLRTGREKMLSDENNMPLRNISNLQAGVTYKITPQWSSFLRGENLLNKHWYLGPAVPSQGITGIIGATYKF